MKTTVTSFLNLTIESFKFSLQGFSKLGLRWKIALITIATTVLICAVITAILAKEYRSERTAYVFEAHSDSIKAITAEINLYLVKTALKSNAETLTEIPENITKIPDGNDLIFEKEKGNNLIAYGRDLEGNITKRQFNTSLLQNLIMGFSDNRIILINQSGEILASTDPKYIRGKRSNTVINFVLDQTNKTASRMLKIDGAKYVVSFREIQDSNLIAVAISSIETIQGDLVSLLSRLMLIAAVLCVISAIFQSIYIQRITNPLYVLIRFFQQISIGNFDIKLNSPNNEFRPILDGAGQMQDEIIKREYRLNIFADGLKNLIEINNNLELTRSPHDLAKELIKTSLPYVNRENDLPPLYLDLKASTLWKYMIQKNGFISSKSQIEHDLSSEFIDHLLNRGSQQTKANSKVIYSEDHPEFTPYYGHQIYLLTIPFAGESKSIGILILPLEKTVYHDSIENFGLVVFQTVKNLFIQAAAQESVVTNLVLNKELNLARSMQEKTIAVQQDVPGAKVQWLFKPAQIVGGDLLIVYQHKTLNLINFYIGDVTGHGIDSAFCTSLISGAIDIFEAELENEFVLSKTRKDGSDLARFAYHLSQLMRRKVSGKQMSMCAGSIFVTTGEVTMLLAGHPPPLALSANYQAKKLPQFSRVGLIGDLDFPEVPKLARFKLSKGESMMLYTDGPLENIETGKSGQTSRKRLLHQLSEISLQSRFDNTPSPEDKDLPAKIYEWSKTAFQSYAYKDDVAILHISMK